MKKNKPVSTDNILTPQDSEQALSIIKSCLTSNACSRFRFTKETVDGEMRYEVGFAACVSKKDYKRLKEFAESVDVRKAINDHIEEVLKNLSEAFEADQCIIIKHDEEANE